MVIYKEPPPSIQDASDRINQRGDSVDDKVKRLDAELCKYKERIKRTRPGPAQEAIKAQAMRVLKQKKMYEGQRDMLYNQAFKLDQVSFAVEGLKDAQQTMTALKSAYKELKRMMKTVKIQDIDNLQDEMMDLMDESSEIQETLGKSYSVADKDDLMGELDALEADMGNETEADRVPSLINNKIWKHAKYILFSFISIYSIMMNLHTFIPISNPIKNRILMMN